MRSSRALLAATLAVAGLGVGAGDAAAAKNPYSAQKLCGSEFKPFRTAAIGNFERTVRVGTVHVLRSKRKADRFCAVTMKSRWLGRKTMTGVSVTGTKQEWAPFEYYAGPLKWTINEPGDRTVPNGCTLVFSYMRNPATQEMYFGPTLKFDRRGRTVKDCGRA